MLHPYVRVAGTDEFPSAVRVDGGFVGGCEVVDVGHGRCALLGSVRNRRLSNPTRNLLPVNKTRNQPAVDPILYRRGIIGTPPPQPLP